MDKVSEEVILSAKSRRDVAIAALETTRFIS
jgi:hypothetical protein